jgi:hypothetical protein
MWIKLQYCQARSDDDDEILRKINGVNSFERGSHKEKIFRI